MPNGVLEPAPVLCLASASPRRSALLAQIGVPHLVAPADVDEEPRAGEAPREYVQRVARAKAEQVLAAGRSGGLPVLAADTTVVAAGRIMPKPLDAAAAVAMLGALSGITHLVLSAVALASGGQVTLRVSQSLVHMRATTAAERAAYSGTGEPFDKAGGYAIQGFAAVFIDSIRGSYSGVVGLPLYETAELLRQAGISYWNDLDGRTPAR